MNPKFKHAIIDEQGVVQSCMEWRADVPFLARYNYVVHSPLAEANDTYDLDEDVLHKKEESCEKQS